MIKYFPSTILHCRLASVYNHLFKIFHFTFLALVLFIVSSCEKGATTIGTGLLPGKDFVSVRSIDTLSAFSYNVYSDSIRTDNPSISFLGQIYSPYFGTTTAEFVSQIRLKPAWDDLPFTIDSVKLFLTLQTVQGNTDGIHTLRLSEIANQIFTDSVYYSYKTVNTTGFDINVELPALRADTINNIEIKLPVEFGNYLTRDTSKLFYSNSLPDFRSYFKGLYFRLSAGSNPLLLSLYLVSPSQTGEFYNYFELYMHDTADVHKVSYFILDAVNKNAAYNRFLHDFSTASPEKRIVHINDGYRDTLSYMQYFNGVYTKITIPGLENFKRDSVIGKMAVNKARLIIPVFFDGDLYKPSTVPSVLHLRYKVRDGSRFDVPDYYMDDLHQFYDGTLDSVANVYNFNLATFIQGYLNETVDTLKPELELYELPSDTKSAILRTNKNKTPVKFEFTYTKF